MVRGLEIERQFILKAVSDETLRIATRSRRIRQGYLTRVGPAIRVRHIADKYVMTVKSGGGFVRREVEFEITPDVAQGLFDIAGESTIDKTRYDVGGWEIDVFHGRHEGLLVGEVELEREHDPIPPVPEGVEVLRDVTEELGFHNQFLASLDAPEARALLTDLRTDPDATLEAVRDHYRDELPTERRRYVGRSGGSKQVP